jgi:hypothetical protein
MQTDSPDIPARKNWLLFIIDHNPCYLLSGLCMLIGCWLLNFALYTNAGDIRKMLLLLLVVNVYELLLITLGLVLIKRFVFRNDGRILLGLETLFLIDITFTSGVLSTIDLHIGLLINFTVLILAALKVFLILRGLNLPHWPRMAVFIIAQIAAILLIPTLYKYIALPRNGRITGLNVYFTWWITALLPLLALILRRLPSRKLLAPTGTERHLGLLLLILPFASLVVHLHSSAWVYSINFTPVFMTPLLFGLALFANLLEPRVQRYLIARLQLFLIAFALYYSIRVPGSLIFSIKSGLDISPLRLTLLATAALFVYFIFHHDNLTYLWTAAICVCAAILGPTLPIMWQNLTALMTSSRRLVPKTTLQWGLTSIAASFLLLALGAIFSLKKYLALHRPTAA